MRGTARACNPTRASTDVSKAYLQAIYHDLFAIAYPRLVNLQNRMPRQDTLAVNVYIKKIKMRCVSFGARVSRSDQSQFVLALAKAKVK